MSSQSADQLFQSFVKADSYLDSTELFAKLCNELQLCPDSDPEFYTKLEERLANHSHYAKLWKLIDQRKSKDGYLEGTSCTDKQVLVIGAGPCGLRMAIECAFLGATVTVIEAREYFSRNNVLYLWRYVKTDLNSLGVKIFSPKFGTGDFDHISTRALQLFLLKIALLLGVQIYCPLKFVDIVQPQDGQGWRIKVDQPDHPISKVDLDVIVGAEGKQHSLAGYTHKTLRGRLAIAVTANLINARSKRDAEAKELGGISKIFNQEFFKCRTDTTGIELENFVYFKSDTHYFVMTIKKNGLLKKGILLEDKPKDITALLSRNNINWDKLKDVTRDIIDAATERQLEGVPFAPNHNGEDDLAIFDFTSMRQAQHSCFAQNINGKKLLTCIVGDALLEPFWPQGTGIARGFLGVLDGAWLIRNWSQGVEPVQCIAEREAIFSLLSQTKPESLKSKYDKYTIDPKSRYHSIPAPQVTHASRLYMEDNAVPSVRSSSPQLSRKQEADNNINTKSLLRWYKDKLKRKFENTAPIKDLNQSWKNGVALLCLVQMYRPGLIDVSEIDDATAQDNCRQALKLIEQEFGVTPTLKPKEICGEKMNKLSLLTYLALLRERLETEMPMKKPRASDPGVSNKENMAKSLSASRKLQTLTQSTTNVKVALELAAKQPVLSSSLSRSTKNKATSSKKQKKEFSKTNHSNTQNKMDNPKSECAFNRPSNNPLDVPDGKKSPMRGQAVSTESGAKKISIDFSKSYSRRACKGKASNLIAKFTQGTKKQEVTIKVKQVEIPEEHTNYFMDTSQQPNPEDVREKENNRMIDRENENTTGDKYNNPNILDEAESIRNEGTGSLASSSGVPGPGDSVLKSHTMVQQDSNGTSSVAIERTEQNVNTTALNTIKYDASYVEQLRLSKLKLSLLDLYGKQDVEKQLEDVSKISCSESIVEDTTNESGGIANNNIVSKEEISKMEDDQKPMSTNDPHESDRNDITRQINKDESLSNLQVANDVAVEQTSYTIKDENQVARVSSIHDNEAPESNNNQIPTGVEMSQDTGMNDQDGQVSMRADQFVLKEETADTKDVTGIIRDVSEISDPQSVKAMSDSNIVDKSDNVMGSSDLQAIETQSLPDTIVVEQSGNTTDENSIKLDASYVEQLRLSKQKMSLLDMYGKQTTEKQLEDDTEKTAGTANDDTVCKAEIPSIDDDIKPTSTNLADDTDHNDITPVNINDSVSLSQVANDDNLKQGSNTKKDEQQGNESTIHDNDIHGNETCESGINELATGVHIAPETGLNDDDGNEPEQADQYADVEGVSGSIRVVGSINDQQSVKTISDFTNIVEKIGNGDGSSVHQGIETTSSKDSNVVEQTCDASDGNSIKCDASYVEQLRLSKLKMSLLDLYGKQPTGAQLGSVDEIQPAIQSVEMSQGTNYDKDEEAIQDIQPVNSHNADEIRPVLISQQDTRTKADNIETKQTSETEQDSCSAETCKNIFPLDNEISLCKDDIKTEDLTASTDTDTAETNPNGIANTVDSLLLNRSDHTKNKEETYRFTDDDGNNLNMNVKYPETIDESHDITVECPDTIREDYGNINIEQPPNQDPSDTFESQERAFSTTISSSLMGCMWDDDTILNTVIQRLILDDIKNDQQATSDSEENEEAPNVCYICDQILFVVNRVSAHGKYFHRNCFKCAICDTLLRVGDSYELADASGKVTIYCQTHYLISEAESMPSEVLSSSMRIFEGTTESQTSIHQSIRLLSPETTVTEAIYEDNQTGDELNPDSLLTKDGDDSSDESDSEDELHAQRDARMLVADEIQQGLEEVEEEEEELQARGVELEEKLIQGEEDEELVNEWLTLSVKQNKLTEKASELILKKKVLELQEMMTRSHETRGGK